MTNRCVNITIESLYLYQESNKTTGIQNSRNDMHVDNMIPKPQERHHDALAKGDFMNITNATNEIDAKWVQVGANLRETTNYLIQLFYKSGRIYTCGATKIGKLLAIAAISYARKNKQLFEENVVRYGECGATIETVKSYLDIAIYLPYNCNDNEEPFEKEFNENEIIPYRYEDISSLDDDVKKLIGDVFRNFGSYSPLRLGQNINTVINYSQDTINQNIIDLQVIPSLNLNEIKQNNSEKNCKLVDYLLKE